MVSYLSFKKSPELPDDEHKRRRVEAMVAPRMRETAKRGVVRQAYKASRSAALGLLPRLIAAGFIDRKGSASGVFRG
jgi:hypothetical protein